MKRIMFILTAALLIIINALSQEISWDTISFEEPYQFFTPDTSSQSLWQIATPDKVFFNEAYDGEKAIITDSLNAYQADNYSYFDIKVGVFNNEYYPYDNFIEFQHKFDTDSLLDGGFITVSTDSGKTWTNIIDTWEVSGGFWMYEYAENLYDEEDTLFNGENGFSGHSGDWLTTRFGWALFVVKSEMESEDTLIIRFNFISDGNNTGKEGWMIDNIRLYSIDLGGAVYDNRLDKLISVFPNPVNSKLSIRLDKIYSTIVVDLIDLKGMILNESQFYNTDLLECNFTEHLKGEYLLKIILEGEKFVTKKIVF